ncbi:acyltransferase family protein [Quatrionicoccus australiensis]|uniref:acyltransferase family protein n=1 Tax=Quatrionicoccus australiensis TaxID=138118 RepID=UPI001CF9A773|nr:acyltransferase family protein [Quatrionicoccus australiensis]MCB4360182.1 acyltransferase [Quatrionicoccus australiensis]
MPRVSHETPIVYRPDIDGLRALAVLSVVLFHASDRLLPGGFVGVDVFFVISGYLISRIILQGLSDRSFSFADFYKKRALRIFPALIVVLLATALLGNFLLFPLEYKNLGKHIAGGAAFVANIVYWTESGYFDKLGEAKPLLHLWSLGIEEQFYLIWPLLLAFFWQFRKSLIWTLLGLAIVSFAANLFWVGSDAASVFYFPGTRFWELILGAILAALQVARILNVGNDDLVSPNQITEQRSRVLRDGFSFAGMAMILGACVGLNRSISYPGGWALLPVLGAVFLIGAGPQAWINRYFLARPFMVFLGLISYPLYLWHWPLLSYARIVESGKPPGFFRALLVFAAVFLAYATYRWIERPLRFGKLRYRVAILWGGMCSIGCFGTFVYFSDAQFGIRATPMLLAQETIESPRNDPQCKGKYPVLGAYCLESAGDGAVTTAIVGDSHANHFMPGLESILRPRNERVVHLGEPGCPVLLGGLRERSGERVSCAAVSESILTFLAQNREIRRIIISFRGPLNTSEKGYGNVEKLLAVRFTDTSNPTLPSAAAIESTLTRTVALLLSRNKEVWLFEDVPELGFHIEECQVRPFSITHKKREPCALPFAEVSQRQRQYHRIVTRVQEKFPNLLVFDPKLNLCDATSCFGMKNHAPLYVDGDHLSRQGSLVALEGWSPVLDESRGSGTTVLRK